MRVQARDTVHTEIFFENAIKNNIFWGNVSAVESKKYIQKFNFKKPLE